MADILIRDVPDEVAAAIDADASRLGLSRSEYLRRSLARMSARPRAVEVEDLARFGQTFADLTDDSVMRDAWR